MTVRRTAILWLGDAPSPDMKTRLERRGLTLKTLTSPSDLDFLSASNIVFSARGRSARPILRLLKSYAEKALTHGLQVLIRQKDPSTPIILASFPILKDRAVFFDPTGRNNEDLAERLRAHDPGPSENQDLDVPPLSKPLPEEDKILLRRAFGDCDTLTLAEITEGKSNALVLRVHAKLAGGNPPGYLLPFLVKIDGIAEIDCEIDRYQHFVNGRIPFTQRPNLEPKRCVTGATRAVMVSDFVEDAVSLSAICQRPDGRRVVYSLFDDALRSWRRYAFAAAPAAAAPITDHLGQILQVDRISDAVRARARRLGLREAPAELQAELAAHSNHAWKLGTIHGDLHPGNVMVRGAEAILIDFASIWNADKPLVADLACLEIGMCFTTATEGCLRSSGRTKATAFKAWRNAIDELFEAPALRRIPPVQEPKSLSWLWDACRQTRTLAAQLEASPAAYAAALVLYMLRRARLGGHDGKNPAIEAYALKTASRVIRLLKGGTLNAIS